MLTSQAPVRVLLTALCLLPTALARTDLDGCVSSETVVYGGASLIWYDPGSGEICSFLDCGGGRAPPKTTKPGCPGYDGTATVTPSFLPGFAAATTAGAQVTDDTVIIPITTEPLTPGTSSASDSTAEPLTTSASGSGSSGSTAAGESSLSQPTAITGSLVSTKTDTDLTPPTVTTSAIEGTAATSSTSSSTAGAAALATAGPREMLALAAGLVAGLAAI